MNNLQTGRTGQLYGKKQAAQGTAIALLAANAMRHISFLPQYDPKNKRSLPEKHATPGRSTDQRTDGRETVNWALEAILRPSGTIATVPELDPVLEAAFGTRTNPAVATTVASGGAVGGATLTSAATLAVNGGVLITCPDGKKRVRRLTAVNAGTGVVAWAPNLPAGQVPANGAAVKSVIGYAPSTVLIIALTFAHYLKKIDGTAGLSRSIYDAAIDKFSLNFDANNDPRIKVSGFAKTLLQGASCPAQPGGFTTVGMQPPSPISGEFVVGASYDLKFLKLAVDVSNGLFARNESYGYSSLEEFGRGGYRDVAVGLDMRAGVDTDEPYASALTGSVVNVFKQTGFNEGNILALSLPNVEFKVPDTDDPDDVVNWPLKGMALESASGGNDEVFLYFA